MKTNKIKFNIVFILIMSFLFSTGIERVDASSTNPQINRIEESFIIENARTLIPMRAIFESLGAEVIWDAKRKTITGTKGETVVVLTVDSNTAKFNGQAILLDVTPVIQNGKTYVPIRFVSQALQARVEWDSPTQTVIVHQQQQYIVINNKSDKFHELNVSGIQMGDPQKLVHLVFGTPKRETLSQHGFTWLTYHQNYKKFTMIGVQNGEVVGLYSNSETLQSKQGLKVGSTISQVSQALGTPIRSILKGNINFILLDSKEFNNYKKDRAYITTFFDTHKNNTLTSVLLIDQKIEENLKQFYGKPSDNLRNSYEKQNFDLTNSIRVRMGLKALKWSDQLLPTTRKHSQDMINRQFFDHINPDGLAPHERMQKDGITYKLAGENIAYGQFNAFYVHEGWLNSLGHRQNILEPEYEYFAVGVAFNAQNAPYFTQNFYK